MDDKKILEIARKRVKDKKDFYAHLNAFCIVSFILFMVNCFVSPGRWWFFLPLIGWAIALIGHYLNVFGFPSFRDAHWEEEQLEKEIDKLERMQALDINEEDSLDLSDEKLDLKEPRQVHRKYDKDDFV